MTIQPVWRFMDKLVTQIENDSQAMTHGLFEHVEDSSATMQLVLGEAISNKPCLSAPQSSWS